MAADALPDRATRAVHDYVSPGLQVVRPDGAFPRLRAGDALHHPWRYLRRDVPHVWYCDERYPLMGFLNRDEAVLLHNIALQFAGRRALEIGSWLGWSTCHLALAGVQLDVIDPAHADPLIRESVEQSLARCGVRGRVNLAVGRSPDSIAALGGPWSLFFIDGDHEGSAPTRDALACLPYAAADCAFVFHDLAAPAVATALRVLAARGFHTRVYQTAQIIGMAWRGAVTPVAHVPDPAVAWQLPPHLAATTLAGAAGNEPTVPAPDMRDAFPGDPPIDTPPSVCLVTSEIIGLFRNGGIGTANSGLAEVLAASGARVTVLYTGSVSSPEVNVARCRRTYAERGIALDVLTLAEKSRLSGAVADHGYVVPWLVHQYLAARKFDVVHFNDCCGDGSLALAAKAVGLAFRDTLLVVGMHSPSQWVFDANQTLAATPRLAAFDFAERISVRYADVVWSPSRYMLEWAASRGFEFPQNTFVQQYAIPQDGIAARGGAETPAGEVKEIVFFGRLEERKGLRLFCSAIDTLRDELDERGITVTFLGKPERCAGMHSLEYIAMRRKSWRFPVRTITDRTQPEALAYLRRDGVLAVMPSPVDNSPCTVYEAIACGIPFLAARTGGIPELIDAADRARVLFEYGMNGLVTAIRGPMQQGLALVAPAVAQAESRRAWRAMHARWREMLPEPAPSTTSPRTFTAVVDHSPGAALDATLTSLSRCRSLTGVVVLNREGEQLPLENVDLTKVDPEVALAAARFAGGEVVLLIHSGVTVMPDALEAMLGAFDAPVDGLQPACRISGATGEEIVPPLGGSAAFSLAEGPTFTGALAVRQDALVTAHADRAAVLDAPFLGLADFCVASGNILPYPAVVLQRGAEQIVRTTSAAPARIAVYEQAPANDRHYIVAAGFAAGATRRPRRYELARLAVNSGFAFAVRAAAALQHRLRRWTG